MNAIKGIYHDGIVELLEKPETKKSSEVLIIFPEKQKKVSKINGMFEQYKIDYNKIKKELKELNRNSEKHIIKDNK